METPNIPGKGQITEEDTICAVSTPPGRGGVGIIRISGGKTRTILEALMPERKVFPPREMVFGPLRDRDGGVLDEAMAVYFSAPHSYTGEDVAELHCHGNPTLLDWVMERIKEICPESRSAQPGEFTKRAYLNKKMDLLEAEAVMDLISATNREALAVSLHQMEGALGQALHPIIERVRLATAGMEAAIDFPEEDWEVEAVDTAITGLREAYGALEDLCNTYHRGRLLMEGIRCAMVGRPNTGKSSLLNAVAGYERAIVDKEEGTTRDVLEYPFSFRGQTIRLMDTAGRRENVNGPEAVGLRLGEWAAQESDVALLILDGSRALTQEDQEAAQLVRNKNVVIALNKTDLPLLVGEEEAATLVPRAKVVAISALAARGLDTLFAAVLEAAGTVESTGVVITNARQRDCLLAARDSVLKALSAHDRGMEYDLVSLDAMEALASLMELTGETARESVIDTIFAQFCVGK